MRVGNLTARRPWRRPIAGAVLGAVVVLGLGAWWLSSRPVADPRTVTGWAMPNERGTAISLHDSMADETGEAYVIAGARWAGPDHVWHEGDGLATCVGTDTSSRTRVRLGIVEVDSQYGGWSHVVWLRCLE